MASSGLLWLSLSKNIVNQDIICIFSNESLKNLDDLANDDTSLSSKKLVRFYKVGSSIKSYSKIVSQKLLKLVQEVGTNARFIIEEN